MVPATEYLYDEFLYVQAIYQRKLNAPSDVITLMTACHMSEYHKIDIRKYMWNILGMKRGSYENALCVFKSNNISYYSIDE